MKAVEARIEELRAHMEAEGELGVDASDVVAETQATLDGTYVLEQKMKLTGKPGATTMFVVPSAQDWVHDALDEVRIVAGTLYADDEPFLEGSAVCTGYFQADDTQRWVRITDGAAAVNASTGDVTWVDDLAEFPEIVAQYEECMGASEYRYVVEQAAMKQLVAS